MVNPHERLDGIAVSERPVVRPAPRLLSVFCVRRDNYGSVQNLIDEIARRLEPGFGAGYLVLGPAVPALVDASQSARAALAGRPGAARAAGTTCARNPLPLVIPCHRVVHAGARRGDVGSYGAATGSSYKRRLLKLEDAPLVRG